MINVNNLLVPPGTTPEELLELALKKSSLSKSALRDWKILRRSVDARRKSVHLNYSVGLVTHGDTAPQKPNPLPQGSRPLTCRPVVIGAGPAGLFCAYKLAAYGYRPLVFERGADVDARTAAVQLFSRTGVLDTQTNIQFGEGGAGTFSDGKLTTRINDPHCGEVLQTFLRHGAPDEIAYQAKPHIGTDILRRVVKSMRQALVQAGGEIRFQSKLEAIHTTGGRITGITVNQTHIPCEKLILAIGHSARDTYQMLYNQGVAMEPKPFAVGVRIEHRQAFIDRAQYGGFAGHPDLGAADYRLAYNGPERKCFSFCMCPGGYVVPAASEEQTVVVNGMSNFARSGENANSALVVNVTPDDFPGVLGGIAFQRRCEQLAFRADAPYCAPVQNTTDFLQRRKSVKIKKVTPTYPIGYEAADLHALFPAFISNTLESAFYYFERKIKGFAAESILTGVETRTSAPVRLTRNSRMESLSHRGLYPVGEGAGYAGGIMSAAVDGLRAAERLIAENAPCN